MHLYCSCGSTLPRDAVPYSSVVWTADVAYLAGLDFFSDVVADVDAQQWQRPSPCAGWTAQDVLGHVGMATDFGAELLKGAAPQWKLVDPPGEAVSGDPGQWWAAKVEPARQAVTGADLDREVDSPMGRRTVGQGLSFPAVDLFVHGWDVARSVGGEVVIPDEAIEFAHQVLDPIPAGMLRSPQTFGDEVQLAASGSATQRFLAWTGRDPR